MKTFYLPDLGEGLTEAEIHQWHVKEGDTVQHDDVLVSMETAKAVVDVPAPYAGKIVKLHGKVGDIIQTNAPLLEFEGEHEAATTAAHAPVHATAATASAAATSSSKTRVLPAIRALASQLNVNLDSVTPTGPNGQITADDVRNASTTATTDTGTASTSEVKPAADMEPIKGVRRSMALAMSQSHAQVVPVTLVDDADINAWPEKTDITMRLVRAIVAACKAEPALNASFDGKAIARKLNTEVHIGIAMDTPDGLFVPVLKNAHSRSLTELRTELDRFKPLVRTREIPPADLHGNTITLSNFGMFAGRYATPIVVPPCVAILGVGRLREECVFSNGEVQQHRILPLSLTFDHRAATGGEASRFLAAVINDLTSAN